MNLNPESLSVSTLVYTDIATDRKFLYPGTMEDLTSNSLNDFSLKVKNGQIPETKREPVKI